MFGMLTTNCLALESYQPPTSYNMSQHTDHPDSDDLDEGESHLMEVTVKPDVHEPLAMEHESNMIEVVENQVPSQRGDNLNQQDDHSRQQNIVLVPYPVY